MKSFEKKISSLESKLEMRVKQEGIQRAQMQKQVQQLQTQLVKISSLEREVSDREELKSQNEELTAIVRAMNKQTAAMDVNDRKTAARAIFARASEMKSIETVRYEEVSVCFTKEGPLGIHITDVVRGKEKRLQCVVVNGPPQNNYELDP